MQVGVAGLHTLHILLGCVATVAQGGLCSFHILLGFVGFVLAAQSEDTIPDCGLSFGGKRMVGIKERQNPKNAGLQMPFGITLLSWESSDLLGRIVFYVATEVLGINARFSAKASSSGDAVRSLVQVTNHVGIELWTLLYLQEIEGVVTRSGNNAPRAVGKMQYSGFEGTFLAKDVQLNAMVDDPKSHLQYHVCYNVSIYESHKYFSKISDIPTTSLATCASGKLWRTDLAVLHLEHTGDDDGVEVLNGTLKYKCMGGALGAWWLSPSCRSHPQKCIPWVTGNSYAIDMCAQTAVAYNMPIACGNALSFSLYTVIPKNYSTLFYWWTPDLTFVNYAIRLQFPEHDRLAWLESDKRTQGAEIPLETWVNGNISRISPQMEYFLSKMALTQKQIDSMLVKMRERVHTALSALPETKDEVACQWLKDNKPIWGQWIKDETSCEPGQGLVDASGNNVLVRVEAFGCARCPSGFKSNRIFDDRGATYTCLPCKPGEAQRSPGEENCVACPQGHYLDDIGQSTCKLCDIGMFTDALGRSGCSHCKSPFTTKSRGATSQKDCVCPEGYYRNKNDRGQCEICVVGMTCQVGSDMKHYWEAKTRNVSADIEYIYPRLQPKYMSRDEDPLKVYECLSDYHCPGGNPGTCAENFDPLAVACGKCVRHTYDAAGGVCKSCSDNVSTKEILPVIVVGTGGIVIIILAIGTDAIKQRRSVTNAVSLMGIVWTSLQILSVFSQLRIEWGRLLSEVLSWGKFIKMDIDFLRLSCRLSVTSTQRLLVRQLIVPFCIIVALGGMAVKKIRQGPRVNFKIEFINVVGTILLSLFTSLVLATISPLICYPHPSAASESMVAEPSVLCFEDPEHLVMIGIGATSFLLVPLPVFVGTLFVTYNFPSLILTSNRRLRACHFLFHRYRKETYYHGSIGLGRNLMICLVPAVAREHLAIQLVLVSVLLQGSALVQLVSRPWLSLLVDMVDGTVALLLATLLLVGGMNSSAAIATKTLESLAGVILCLAILAPLIAFIYNSKAIFRPEQVAYLFCYNTAEAAAQVRLAQLLLNLRRKTCFLECDSLDDFGNTLEVVRSGAREVLIYLTMEMLRKPTCAMEIVVCYETQRRITLIQTSAFVSPSERDLTNLGTYLTTNEKILAAFGMTLEYTAHAYRWMLSGSHRRVVLATGADRFSRLADEVSGTILSHSSFVRTSSVTELNSIIVSSDPEDDEGTACAHIVMILLAQRVFDIAKGGFYYINNVCEHSKLMISLAEVVMIFLTQNSVRCQVQATLIKEVWEAHASNSRLLVLLVPLQSFQSQRLSVGCNIEFSGSTLEFRPEIYLDRFPSKRSVSLHIDTSSTILNTEVHRILDYINDHMERTHKYGLNDLIMMLLNPDAQGTYLGEILDEEGIECIASFPGRFLSGWKAVAGGHHGCSVGCVYLPSAQEGLGRHAEDPENPGKCYCAKIYGERDWRALGYLIEVPEGASSTERKIAREKATAMNAFFWDRRITSISFAQAQREAEKKWKQAGRIAAWGCHWFVLWMNNIKLAVAKSQKLVVFCFPGEVGMGKIPWEKLNNNDFDLWDGVGLGGSQKAEVAFLDKMQLEEGDAYRYEERDVQTFIDEYGNTTFSKVSSRASRFVSVLTRFSSSASRSCGSAPTELDNRGSSFVSRRTYRENTERVERSRTEDVILQEIPRPTSPRKTDIDLEKCQVDIGKTSGAPTHFRKLLDRRISAGPAAAVNIPFGAVATKAAISTRDGRIS